MYSDHELRELCKNFENYNIPLDVLVIDMDWHYTDKGRGVGPDGHGTKSCFLIIVNSLKI